MNESAKKKIDMKRYCFLKKVIVIPVFFAMLLFIAVAVPFSVWKPMLDNRSDEAIIRRYAAEQLNKYTHELYDEDFVKITKFNLIPRYQESGINSYQIRRVTEIYDISLFAKFTNLQELDLSGIHYPETKIPKWMKTISKYSNYDLDKRFAINLSPLKNLHSINTLILSGANIYDITLLEGLINIEKLYLDNTHVTDLEPLSGFVNLQYLNLSETPITNFEPIKKLKNLKRLLVINCKNITAR